MFLYKALGFVNQLGLATDSEIFTSWQQACPLPQDLGTALTSEITKVRAHHLDPVTKYAPSAPGQPNGRGKLLKQSAAAKNLNWNILADNASHFWTGQLFVGSQATEIEVIFDTSSDWLALEGQDCLACGTNFFNATDSTSATMIGTVTSERKYNDLQMNGTEWSDKVCLSDLACVSFFEFFLIESQTPFDEPSDGYLGLGRT